MSDLPARLETARSSWQVSRAVRAQEQTELAVFQHSLDARYLAEVDRIDSQAIADVTKAALEEELSVLGWGLEQAAGRPAAAELVSRMVAQQSKLDLARISRRFGG